MRRPPLRAQKDQQLVHRVSPHTVRDTLSLTKFGETMCKPSYTYAGHPLPYIHHETNLTMNYCRILFSYGCAVLA